MTNEIYDRPLDDVEFLSSWKAWLCTSSVVLFVFILISFVPTMRVFFQTKSRWPFVVYSFIPFEEISCNLLFQKKRISKVVFLRTQLWTSIVFEIFVAVLGAYSSWKGAAVFLCLFLMVVVVHAYGFRSSLKKPYVEIGAVLAIGIAASINSSSEHVVIYLVVLPVTVVCAFLVGEAARIFEIKRIESEQLRSEVQNKRILCEAERVESLSEMLEDIALWNHDMRNKMSVVSGQVIMMSRLLCPVGFSDEKREKLDFLLSKVKESVDFFSLGLNEVGGKTKKIHEQNQRIEAVALEFEIKNSIEIIKTQFPRVRFEFSREDAAPRVVTVVGGVACFRRIIENTLVNACEGNGREMADFVFVKIKKEEEFLAIETQDNGPGFSEELLNPVLCYFKTTKLHGTGLGLLAIEKMMVNNKGQIMRKNLQQGGASVTVFFPIQSCVEATSLMT